MKSAAWQVKPVDWPDRSFVGKWNIFDIFNWNYKAFTFFKLLFSIFLYPLILFAFPPMYFIILYLLIYIELGWQANLGEAQTDISPAPNWILVLLMLLLKLNKLLLAILLFPPIFVADRHITCDEFNLPFLLVLLMLLPKLSNRWGTASHDFTLVRLTLRLTLSIVNTPDLDFIFIFIFLMILSSVEAVDNVHSQYTRPCLDLQNPYILSILCSRYQSRIQVRAITRKVSSLHLKSWISSIEEPAIFFEIVCIFFGRERKNYQAFTVCRANTVISPLLMFSQCLYVR